MAETHDHDAVAHAHDHMHVTHYYRPGEDVTHFVATHRHEHNHPALSHSHERHEDMEKEHPREATSMTTATQAPRPVRTATCPDGISSG